MKKKFFISAIVVVIGGIFFWLWHMDRKSNHDPRGVSLSQFDHLAKATFAGGCFWCTESDFEKTEGVVEVVSGYTGGERQNPSYYDVSSGATRHREAVQVFFDPEKVSYEQLLAVFWRHADPTDDGGQFVDRGFQYTTAVFYHDAQQKKIAQESKKALESSGKFERPIVTPILPATDFFVAEDYHQDYHKNNPVRYGFYRGASGRDDYVAEVWGDELKKAQNHSSNEQQKTDNE